MHFLESGCSFKQGMNARLNYLQTGLSLKISASELHLMMFDTSAKPAKNSNMIPIKEFIIQLSISLITPC